MFAFILSSGGGLLSVWVGGRVCGGRWSLVNSLAAINRKVIRPESLVISGAVGLKVQAESTKRQSTQLGWMGGWVVAWVQRKFSRAVRTSIVWERGEVGGCAARCVHQESKAFIVGMRSRCRRGISPDCSSFVFHAWTSDAAFLAVSSCTHLSVNSSRPPLWHKACTLKHFLSSLKPPPWESVETWL